MARGFCNGCRLRVSCLKYHGGVSVTIREKLVGICDSLGLVLQNRIFFILVFAEIQFILHRGIFHVNLFSYNACDDKQLSTFSCCLSACGWEKVYEDVCIKKKQNSRDVCSPEAVKDTFSANLHAFKNCLKF